jgi:hypothetical protein
MSIPKSARCYLDYAKEIEPGVKDCLMANWGSCPSCKCNVFPSEMRAFKYKDEIFFEGVCPQCGRISIAAYNRVID